MRGSCRVCSPIWVDATLLLLLTGCNLIAPLSPIKLKPSDDADGGVADEDAGVVRDAGTRPMRPTVDAGTGPTACRPPRGSPCDPVAQCGCPNGEACFANVANGGASECLPAFVPRPGEGDRCNSSNPCAEGLQCPVSGLCSRLCRSDDECGGGICATLQPLNDTNASKAPLHVCAKVCDPLSRVDCIDDTTCVPTLDPAVLVSSVCGAIQPHWSVPVASAVDEPCSANTDCGPGLGCIITGMGQAGLCVPWCRSNRDCPPTRSVCQLLDWFYAGPDDEVGQCVPVQSGTTVDGMCSLAEPPTWEGEPVWSLDEYLACTDVCAADFACYAAMCDGGDIFRMCASTVLERCAGGASGGCRAEYVEASCCHAQHCATADDVTSCHQMYCANAVSVLEMCEGNATECVNDILATCIR